MKVREATEADSDQIRTIAEQSFQTSYALSPLEIETVTESEFDDQNIASRINDDAGFILVAESDDAILGFVEARVPDGERGEIIWLHVDPIERGQGVGTELFERMLAKLRERVVEEIQVMVLAQNQEGGEFVERFDFKPSGQREYKFGGEPLRAEIYSNVETEQTKEEEEDTLPESEEIEVDGVTRFIDPKESISGDKAPILLVFEEERRETRFGFYCTNCGSFTDSVDGDGKVVCENCGNVHNPEEWDASYL